MNAIDLIPAKRIVPVVVINDAAHAVPLAEALVDSGIESIEVTLRTSAAMKALAAIAQSSVSIKVGAGSVATADQLRACLLYTSPSPRDATLSRMPSSA